jgi:hypothetical protein
VIGAFRGLTPVVHIAPPAPFVALEVQGTVGIGIEVPTSDCYAVVVLADEPELYWRFGDEVGDDEATLIDSSPNAHTGAVNTGLFNTHGSAPFNGQSLVRDPSFLEVQSDTDAGLEADVTGITLVVWGIANGNPANVLVSPFQAAILTFENTRIQITWTFTTFTTEPVGLLLAEMQDDGGTFALCSSSGEPQPNMERLVARWDGTNLDLIRGETTVATDTPGGSWVLPSDSGPDGVYAYISGVQSGDTGNAEVDEFHYHLSALTDEQLAEQYAARDTACT